MPNSIYKLITIFYYLYFHVNDHSGNNNPTPYPAATTAAPKTRDSNPEYNFFKFGAWIICPLAKPKLKNSTAPIPIDAPYNWLSFLIIPAVIMYGIKGIIPQKKKAMSVTRPHFHSSTSLTTNPSS
jgi:hypothetical protein